MKSVLISIQPKWCVLIAAGEKTVEVRKTRPKIDVPFKVYIYCTSSNVHECLMQNESGVKLIYCINYKTAIPCGGEITNGKVMGEFICDCITGLKADNMVQAYYNNTKDTCLTDEEIKRYANGKKLYYWHITNLVIYDKPKELGEFYVEGDCDCMNCKNCYWFDSGNGYNVEDDCNLAYKGIAEHKSFKPITRPPQSWCYVEE